MITEADVAQIAALAQLQLSDDERTQLAQDVVDILTWVEAVEQGPTATASRFESSRRRQDVAATFDGLHLTEGAPMLRNGLYCVPAVLPPS